VRVGSTSNSLLSAYRIRYSNLETTTTGSVTPAAATEPEITVKVEEKLVVFGYGRERLYTREQAKALAREITCELLTITTPKIKWSQDELLYIQLYNELMYAVVSVPEAPLVPQADLTPFRRFQKFFAFPQVDDAHISDPQPRQRRSRSTRIHNKV
jgi:hypothetical protein